MFQTLDRESPIPLYHQLKQIVLQRIQSAEWQTGDLIPSEQELQDAYGLSRTTVRLALSDLVADGLLVRERGRGTFVAHPARRPVTHDPASGLPLSAYIVKQGLQPTWKLLRGEWVIAPDAVREALGLDVGIGVYNMELLFSADNEPIGHHSVFVPRHALSHVAYDAFDEAGWLAFMRELPRTPGYRTQRTIQAVSADADRRALLDLDANAPVLSIQALTYDSDEQPVQLILAYFNGVRFKYQITG
jgi:GntR family transcriptional regulator